MSIIAGVRLSESERPSDEGLCGCHHPGEQSNTLTQGESDPMIQIFCSWVYMVPTPHHHPPKSQRHRSSHMWMLIAALFLVLQYQTQP